MKLRKAMEQSITDVEHEEEEAAVEHGDAETAAKAAEQQSMRSITAKLMGAQKAAKGMAVTLTEDQQEALVPLCDAVKRQLHETFLLHGVTGSGKTEVYLRAIAEEMREQRYGLIQTPAQYKFVYASLFYHFD